MKVKIFEAAVAVFLLASGVGLPARQSEIYVENIAVPTADIVIAPIVPIVPVAQTATEPLPQPEQRWTEQEARMLARLIYSEARGEGREGMLLVAQCVLDRLEAGQWGDSIRKIVLSKQFARQGKLTEECYEVAVAALNGERALPDCKVYYFKATKSKKDWYADYITHIGGHAVYGESVI